MQYLRYFNSIKVRLELVSIVSFLNVIINFNSIKVRLEPDNVKRESTMR